MARIRLRLRRGYRADVVEIPLRDTLLGSDPHCTVVIDGVADRHAMLLPRRGTLLLAPAANRARRPVLEGTRLEAPVILADRIFQLADVQVGASLATGSFSLSGQTVLGWSCGRQVGSARLVRRIYEARHTVDSARSGRVHQLPSASESWLRALERHTEVARDGDAVAWVEPAAEGISLDVLVAAHVSGAVTWPVEAAIVIVTQLAEALCEFQERVGPHGAVRPELVFLDVDGRVSLGFADPSSVDFAYQAEHVRLGGRPDAASDAFGWWRLAHVVLGAFSGLKAVRARLPVPPRGRAAMLEAAEGVRRWAVEAGLDPTAVHLARGVRVAHQAPPVGRVGVLDPQTVVEKDRYPG